MKSISGRVAKAVVFAAQRVESVVVSEVEWEMEATVRAVGTVPVMGESARVAVTAQEEWVEVATDRRPRRQSHQARGIGFRSGARRLLYARCV
ncbi:MAG TPA: hypothetical protein VJR03_02820 [Nitrospira sp.]|nr:hypothetical protein [Nitrospira sp.]